MIAAIAAVAGISAAVHSNASAATSDSVLPCTPTMTAAKCEAVQHPPALSNNGRHVKAAPENPIPPAPRVVSCAAGFVSHDAAARLTARFGHITCFRFSHGRSWVIIGNGVSATAATLRRTPGGAIVAVETCAAAARTCLSADSPHPFSGFTVFRGPDPAAFPLELEAVLGSDVLYFSNSSCGDFTFDITNHDWYRGTMAETQRLLSSPRSLAPVVTGHPTPASRALTGGVPAAATSACFTSTEHEHGH